MTDLRFIEARLQRARVESDTARASQKRGYNRGESEMVCASQKRGYNRPETSAYRNPIYFAGQGTSEGVWWGRFFDIGKEKATFRIQGSGREDGKRPDAATERRGYRED